MIYAQSLTGVDVTSVLNGLLTQVKAQGFAFLDSHRRSTSFSFSDLIQAMQAAGITFKGGFSVADNEITYAVLSNTKALVCLVVSSNPRAAPLNFLCCFCSYVSWPVVVDVTSPADVVVTDFLLRVQYYESSRLSPRAFKPPSCPIELFCWFPWQVV